MTSPTPSAAAFRAARDHLLAHRSEQAALARSFRWPALTHFNWALDHFDRVARERGDAPALWIVNEGARKDSRRRWSSSRRISPDLKG